MPKLQSKLNKEQIKELEEKLRVSDDFSEIRRVQCILLLDKKLDISTITQLTNLGRSQIFDIRKRFLLTGIEIVNSRPRKYKRLLTKTQLSKLENTLKTLSPLALGYNTDYWTTIILADYIESEYDVKYKSKTSYQLIFRQARFSFHKPEGVYKKHNPQLVVEWKQKNYEIIKQAFNDENTMILCEDEAIIRSTTTFQKVWLPIGEYPQISVSNLKQNVSLYGFLNIKTGDEHLFSTKDKQTMYKTKDMLEKIREIYPDKKILLLWDSAGWHMGSIVQNYIKQDDKNIIQINFPPYSPELNPQEHVWKEIRKECLHNKYIEKIDDKVTEITSYSKSRPFCYKLLDFGI